MNATLQMTILAAIAVAGLLLIGWAMLELDKRSVKAGKGESET
jgi:hypothetical protein